jgi:hypothetical protein
MTQEAVVGINVLSETGNICEGVKVLFNHLFNPWIMSIRNILSAGVFMLLAMTVFAQTISPTVQPAQGGTFTGGNLQMQFTIGQPLNQTFTAGSNEFSLGFNQPEQNLIIDSAVGNLFCAGDSIRVYYTALGVYGPGNLFTVQLSNAAGNFVALLNIATDTGRNSGNIAAIIPTSIASSSNYRVRVVSSYPVFIGGPSSFFNINSRPDSVLPTVDADSVCPANSTIINIPHSGLGVRYDFSIGETLINSAFGYGGTLSVFTPQLDTTTNFGINATNSLSSCNTKLPNVIVNVSSKVGNPIFTTGDSIVCIGNISTYQATATNASSISYSVYGGANINNVTGQVSNVTGSFVVVATATGAMDCGSSQTAFRVNVPQINVPLAPTSQITCSDTTAILNIGEITSGFGGTKTEWTLDSTFGSFSSIPSPGNIFFSLGSGQTSSLYLRSVDSVSGCSSNPVTTVVTVNAFPSAYILPSDTTVAEVTAVSLQAFGGTSYAWSDNNGDSAIAIVNAIVGSTSYVVTVTNAQGCQSAAQSTVHAYAAVYPLTVNVNLTTSNGSLCDTSTCMVIVSYSGSSWAAFTLNIYDSLNHIPVIVTAYNLHGNSNMPVISNTGGNFVLTWDTANHNTLHPGTDTLTYSFVSPCFQLNSSSPPVLFQKFFIPNYTDSFGNNLHLAINGSFANPDSILTSMPFPLVQLTPSASTVNVVNGAPTCFGFKIQNNESPYSGPLYFIGDTFTGPCANSVVLNSIQVKFPTGGIETFTTHLDSIIDLNHDPFNNGMPDAITTSTPISVTECITVPCGSSDICKAHFRLQWYACTDSPYNCLQNDVDSIPMTSAIGAAHVSISRISPGPGPADLIFNPQQYAWDGSCMGEDQPWEYLIINDGIVSVDSVFINLANDDTCNASYTLLDGLGTFCATNDSMFSLPTGVPPASIGTVVAPPLITSYGSPGYLCNQGSNELQSYSAFVSSLAPGQYVVLHFNTLRCCPKEIPFNQGADFNRWTVNTTYSYCGNNSGGAQNANPVQVGTSYPHQGGGTTTVYPPFAKQVDCNGDSANFISSQVLDGEPDLFLVQSYHPGDANLVGQTCVAPPGGAYPTHVCTGNKQQFHVTNLVFSAFSSTSFNSNAPSDYDTQLFTDSGIANNPGPPYVTGNRPQGQFMVFFQLTPGAEMSADSIDEPTITNPAYPGTTWSPVAYSTFYNSTTGFASIPWNGLPIPEGNAVGVAIFDISSLCSGSNNSCISNTSDNFRKFFINSSLNFNLVGYCPLPPNTTQSTVTVQTSFDPLPSPGISGCIPYYQNGNFDTGACMIPLSQVTFPTYLHCPGCVTPGLITEYNIRRDVYDSASIANHTIGYQDNNNDGLPDLNTMPTANNPNMDTIGAIVGDILTGTAKATFVDGSVFTYSSMGRKFGYLYFEQDIVNMPQFDLSLTCSNAKIIYLPVSGTSSTVQMNSSNLPLLPSIFPVTPDSTGQYRTFLFIVPLTQLMNPDSLREGDQFILTAQYSACNNPDSNIDIVFNNYMYFTVDQLPVNAVHPAPYQTYQTAGDVYQASDTTYAQDSILYANALYYCDAKVGNATIFPIVPVFSEKWTNNLSCTDTVTWQAGYQIANMVLGHPYPNAFPYEYRYVPWIAVNGTQNPNVQNGAELRPWTPSPLQFKLTVPPGYTASFLNTYSVAPVYTNGIGVNYQPIAQGINNVMSAGDVNSTGTVIITSSVNDSLVNFIPPYPGSSSNTLSKPSLFIGDEIFLQTMQFTIQRQCTQTASTSQTVTGDVSALIPNFSSCNVPDSGIAVPVNDSNLTAQYLNKPAPSVAVYGQTYTGANGQMVINFALQTGEAPVNNFEFYFDTTSTFFGSQVSIVNSPSALTCLNGCPVNLVQSGHYDVYQLGCTLAPNSIYTFSLTFEMNSCISSTVADTLPLYYVWDCNGYPTVPVDTANHCGSTAQFPLRVFWSTGVTETPIISTVKTCQNSTYTFCLSNSGTNAITTDSFQFAITNSVYFTPTCIVTKVVNGTTITLSTSTAIQSIVCPPTDSNSYCYAVNLSSYDTVQIENGSKLCVALNFVPTCHDSTMPYVYYGFNYTKYCGQTVSAIPYYSNTIAIQPKNGCDSITVTQLNDVCNQQNNYVHVIVLQYGDQNPADTNVTGINSISSALSSDPTQIAGLFSNPRADSVLPVTTTYNFTDYIPSEQYVFTMTNADGCIYKDTFTPAPAPPVFSFDVEVVPSGCNGSPIKAIITNQQPPNVGVNYTWYNGAINELIGDSVSGLTYAGYYVVGYLNTIANQTSCSVQVNFSVPSQDTTPVLTIKVTTTMQGCASGTATVTGIRGGTGPYSYAWSGTTITTSSISGLSPGYYTVTVTDSSSGCSGVAIDTIPVKEFALDTIVVTPANCGSLSGAIRIVATPLPIGSTHDGTFTFVWNNGDSTALITGLAYDSTYRVTVTDANGCTTDTSVTIGRVDTSFRIKVLLTNPDCHNNQSGSIFVTAIDGDSLIHYTWNNGDTTQSISGLAYNDTSSRNIYTVTATDGAGCTTTATAVIDSTKQLRISLTETPVSCTSGTGDDGKVTCTATGTTPYLFTWSDDTSVTNSSNSISNLRPGSYSVTVTDVSGCTARDTVAVTDTALLLTLQTTNIKCYGGSTGKLKVSNPQAGYIFTWSNGGTKDSTTGLVAGLYYVTVQDGNGCSAADSAFVTQPQNPLTDSFSVTPVLCVTSPADHNGTISTVVSGGTPPYSYNWHGGVTSANRTGLSAGLYYLTVTDSSSCVDSVSVQVTQPDSVLKVAITLNDMSCNGNVDGYGTISGGTSPYLYQWFFGSTAIPVNVTYEDQLVDGNAGTYTINVTDANGCTASITDSIKLLNISAITHNVTCYNAENGDIILSVSGGSNAVNPIYTYHWTGITGNDSVASNLSPGTYSVTVTDASGCSVSDSASITQPTLLIASGGTYYATCHYSNIDSLVVLVSGGTYPYSYHWGNGDTIDYITGQSPGIYPVTVTDANNCTTIVRDTVAALFSLNISGNAKECGRNIDTLTGVISGGTAPFSYHWSTGDTDQVLIDFAMNGTYSLTVTDAHGCTITNSITVTYFEAGIIAQNYNLCFINDGYNATIDLYNSGIPPYTFQWDSTGIASPVQDTANPAEYHVSIADTGQYELLITDSAGCSINMTFAVYSQYPFHLADGITAIGCNTVIEMDVTGGTGQGHVPYSYNWSNGGIGSYEDYGDYIVTSVLGTYTVTITDVAGCSAIDTIGLGSYPSKTCCFVNTPDTIFSLTKDTVWSDTLHLSSDSFIYIYPGTTLIIDSTFTLKRCEIVLGANAQIIVEAGDTLNILGSSLHGCDTMWNGIYVNFQGAINVDEYDSVYSEIQDAMNGVVIQGELDDSKAMFRHTKFNRNQTSISFKNYSPNATDMYDVSDCYFGMGTYAFMLPAPHGYANYKRPITGISVAWANPLDITFGLSAMSLPNPAIGGGPNTFQYLNCGVSAQGCPLTLYANSFDSIRNYEELGGFNYGAAVAGMWATIGGRILQPNFGNLTVQTASSAPDSLSTIFFNNCDYGVKASSITLSATNNRMENVTYGIYTKTANRTVTAINNYIHNTSYGVSLLNNSSANQTVSGNTLYVNPPTIEWIPTDTIITHGLRGGTFIAYTLGDLQTYGIEETEVTGSSTLIYGNAIWNGLNCIVLTNAKGTRIESNALHQMDNTAVFGQRAGLYATSCSGIYVSSNTCYSDTNYYEGIPNVETYVNLFGNTGPYVYRKSGLAFYNTYNGTVCNNTLGGTTANTGIGYGMLFSSFCYGLSVHANTMHQSYFGLTMQSSGVSQILDDQGGSSESQQNSFDGNGTGDFAGGYRNYSFINTDSFYTPPKFYYDTSQGLTNPDTGDATINGIILFRDRITPKGLTSSSIFPYFCFDYIPIPFPHPIHKIGLMDSVIAQNNTKNYMEPGFDSTDTWLPSKILYESLYSADSTILANSLMSAFYANENDSDVSVILQSEIQNQQLTDSTTLADTVSYDGKASGYADALSNANTYNSNIPTTNIQAVNYVTMSSIYLETAIAGIDTFTTGQLDTIMSLAVQCPYLAGDAVYMARALYAQYDNTIYFDDLAICTPPSGRFERALRAPNNTSSDTSAKAVTSTDYIIVYPNPAKNTLKIFYSSETNSTIMIELTDLMGQPIISRPVASMSTIELDISNIASGLYLWRGRNGSLIVQTGKVSVQK